MMEEINLYNIEYYEKTVFKGSYRGMCFRIGKRETPVDNGSSEDTEASGDVVKKLHVWSWKGPYILEKTSEEVYEADFDFSDEGLIQANEWIEAKQKEVMNNDND